MKATPPFDQTGNCVGFEQLTVSTSAVGLASIPQYADRAVVVPETDLIRFRYDGTSPTASVGMPLYPNASLNLNNRDQIDNFEAIRHTDAGSDVTLNILYYGS